MRKFILIFMLVFLSFFFAAKVLGYEICSSDTCDNQKDQCMLQDGTGWCCGTNFYPGTDCILTKVYFKELPESLQMTCLNNPNIPESSNLYVGLKGETNYLNVTVNVSYNGIQYDEIEVNCTLNEKNSCEKISSTDLISCQILNPFYNFKEVNEIVCVARHPTLYNIKNTTARKFKAIDFNVPTLSYNLTTGKNFLLIPIQSTGLLSSDFTLRLSSDSTFVKILNPIKKTNTLSCGEKTEVSFEVDSSQSGKVKFKVYSKPNIVKLSCVSDANCSFYENGKCIDQECWKSNELESEIKSNLPFTIPQVFIIITGSLGFLMLILVLESLTTR